MTTASSAFRPPGDFADSPRASHWPDIAEGIDSLPDHLREKIESYNGPIPLSVPQLRVAFAKILRDALKEMNCRELENRVATGEGDLRVTVEILQLLSRDIDRHYSMRAFCMLRLLGREPRSLQAIADELGTTKQNVDKCYRQLQDRLGGIPGRADKSHSARAKYRQLRLGQMRERAPWAARSTWASALQNLLSPSPLPPLPSFI